MIIAVCNHKGGVGKSATAQAIATGATMRGHKTLAIDLDGQANLSFCMGGFNNAPGAYELLTGWEDPRQLIQHTQQGDIISGSIALASADTTITGEKRAFALRDALKPILPAYDLIVIDCPPALNILLVNALNAADQVIIPLTTDMFALQGLYLLTHTIREAQEKTNPRLKIGGAVFVKHSTRTILARDMGEVIKDKCAELGVPVYASTIRESVAVREAQVQRESIFTYAPKSKPARDYENLLTELGL